MSIVFYYAPRTSSTAVHWALEELGLPYDARRVDLAAGAQREPAYLAINPNGKVPALVVDGVPMFESLAILQYLGERFGVARNLWPSHESPSYPAALAWSVWSFITLRTTLFRAAMQRSERTPPEQKNAAVGAAAEAELEGLYAMLEAHLGEGEYMLGGHFTLVDIAVHGAIAMAGFFKLFDAAKYPRVGAWAERCGARPDRATAVAG